MKRLECLAQYDLEECADSVEWCTDTTKSHLFACGTYQLSGATRRGSLLLFSFTAGGLTLLQKIELGAGLLDSKWSSKGNRLAVAKSDGNLQIYQLNEEELTLLCETQVSDAAMLLAVDWCDDGSSDESLAVSMSDGRVAELAMTPSGPTVLRTYSAHQFEAWAVAFNYPHRNIILSGGDDCKLNVFDTRSDRTKPVKSDSSHSVGVTCIQSNRENSHLISTASYEDVRIWQWKGGELECIEKEEMSGGSWRVKWRYSGGTEWNLAVAAMHTGFSVLQWRGREDNISCQDNLDMSKNDSVRRKGADSSGTMNCKEATDSKLRLDYRGPHSNLGYGIDWAHNTQPLLALCSFYDKKLSIGQLV